MLKKDMEKMLNELEAEKVTLSVAYARIKEELVDCTEENKKLKKDNQELLGKVRTARFVKDHEVSQKLAYKDMLKWIIKEGGK